MHMGDIFEFVFLLWKPPHQRSLRLACETVPTGNESLKSAGCSINHPIFHEGTKASASPRSSSLSSLVLTRFLPSLPYDLPYLYSFFLLPSGHLPNHIWCLLQGRPRRQVASEGQCKQVSPSVSLTLPSHAPVRDFSPGFLPNWAPLSLSSENNKPTSSKTTFQLELPVKYAVYMVISRYLIPALPFDL